MYVSDIDECASVGACDLTVSSCVNTIGSYVCDCNDGFVKENEICKGMVMYFSVIFFLSCLLFLLNTIKQTSWYYLARKKKHRWIVKFSEHTIHRLRLSNQWSRLILDNTRFRCFTVSFYFLNMAYSSVSTVYYGGTVKLIICLWSWIILKVITIHLIELCIPLRGQLGRVVRFPHLTSVNLVVLRSLEEMRIILQDL